MTRVCRVISNVFLIACLNLTESHAARELYELRDCFLYVNRFV